MKKNGLLFSLHKWCGLLLAGLLVLQASTGILLSLRGELTNVFFPAEAPALNNGLLSEHVVNWQQREHGNLSLNRIHFYDTVALARLHLPDSDWPLMALFDRSSGELIKAGGLSSFPLELSARLHYSLVAGEVGSVIIGLEGLLLFGMVLTGLWLWWPAAGRWRQSLKVHLSLRGTALWLQLHKVAGAWLALLLLVLSFTGFVLVFEDALKPVVGRFAPVDELAMPRLPKVETPLQKRGYASALAALDTAFPGERLRQLRFVGPDHRALIVILHNETGERSHALNFAVIDRADNQLAATFRADEAGSGEKLFQSILPIHTGHIAGWPGRLLNVLAGAGLLLMSLSGVLMWLGRRRLRAQRTAGQNAIIQP